MLDTPKKSFTSHGEKKSGLWSRFGSKGASKFKVYIIILFFCKFNILLKIVDELRFDGKRINM